MNRVLVPPLDRPPARDPRAVVRRAAGATMGTTWSLAYARSPMAWATHDAVVGAVQGALDGVVAQMSPWEPASALARFNAAAGGAWIAAPPDLLIVLEAALEAARLTHGAYDPTCGALTEAWGFGPSPAAARTPSGREIAVARAACGWRRLRVEGGRLYQPGGLKLDLNACAKGFGVDKAAAAIEACGVASYLVEVGGELRGAGAKPDGTPWWVEVEALPDAPAEPRHLVALTGWAIATSADHRRAFEAYGRTFGHTLDMRTGRPRAEGRAQCATVLHRSCLWADLLATCALVVSPGEALALAEHLDGAVSLSWSDRATSCTRYRAMADSDLP